MARRRDRCTNTTFGRKAVRARGGRRATENGLRRAKRPAPTAYGRVLSVLDWLSPNMYWVDSRPAVYPIIGEMPALGLGGLRQLGSLCLR